MRRRTAYQIGYIAGTLEKRGAVGEIYSKNHGVELQFGNWQQAKFVAEITGGRFTRHWQGRRRSKYFVYIAVSEAIGWMMTTYLLVSPPTQERFDQLIISWKAGQLKRKRPATCHPNKPHHAKGKCAMCYKRFVHNTPMATWRKLD